MDITQVTVVIGTAASLVCTLVVGALTFFIKRTLSTLEAADRSNAERITKVEEKLNDLKSDLPLVYTTRDDFVRVTNNVDQKLDKLLYRSGAGG